MLIKGVRSTPPKTKIGDDGSAGFEHTPELVRVSGRGQRFTERLERIYQHLPAGIDENDVVAVSGAHRLLRLRVEFREIA